MTSRDFVYWLQGYFELHGPGPLTAEQSECVSRHLSLVFKHEIDPSAGNAAHQEKLNEVHKPPQRPEAYQPSGTASGGHMSPLIRC